MPVDSNRAQALFLAAFQLSEPTARDALLDRECPADPELRARVEALLAAHDDSAGLPAPLVDDRTGAFAPPPSELAIGTLFAGRYKIREMLGEGGMGTVYVADQTEPVQRRVALKVIKADVSTARLLARFEQERQALALMDHPNIAKVLDAGVAGTTPYFVMELIKGVPITKFCDEAQLTPRQRLELFVPVCQAVQHAHQKGIIHRDLKPSNILVGLYDSRPVPKVIDFGVAKATASKLTDQSVYTEVGAVIGTLEYMSPEQAELNNLDIDTRSDIYALGVVLYELLTGSVPLSRKELKAAGMAEMLRIIKEVEPQKPSTRLSGSGSLPSLAACRHTEPKKLTKLFRGELDWMVMKALEKDRSRRYETANGFAMDIQRYLADEPVQAGPPSAAYRMKKFVKRNKAQVVAAGLVLFALIAGVVGTTLGLLEARRQTELARTQEAEAKRQEGLARDEAAAKEQARAEEEVQRKRAVEFRDKALDALRATTGTDVEQLIGGKKELGANEKAYLEAIAKRWQAFAGQEGTDEQAGAIRAEGHTNVALLWLKLGRREEARPEYEQSRLLWEKLAADYPAVPGYRRDLARSHGNLGILLKDLGKRAEAEEHYAKTHVIQEKLVADFPAVPDYRRDLAGSHQNLGKLLLGLGKRTEAEEHYTKALVIREMLVADFPAVPGYRSDLAASHYNLGVVLAGLGRGPEAEEHYKKAIVIQEKLAADFPAVPDYRRDLAGSQGNLGILLEGLGKRAKAEEHHKKALVIKEKLAADYPSVPDHRSNLAVSHFNVGALLAGFGKRAEAEEHYKKGLAINEKLAADYPAALDYRRDLAASQNNMGFLLAGLGRGPEAEEHYKKALASQEKLVADFPAAPDYRSDMAGSHSSLGTLLAGLGKPAEAEEQYVKALALQEKLAADFPVVPDYRRNLAASHTNLGVLLKNLGKVAEAEEHYTKALAILEKLAADFPAVPGYRIGLGGSYCNFGNVLGSDGRANESLGWFDKAVATLTSVHRAEPRDVMAKQFLRNSHVGRAMAYDQLRKYADAVKDWDRVVELTPPAEQTSFRASRATARLQVGMVAEAVAEVAELTKSTFWPAPVWYDFACVYAVASGKFADKKQAYADRAMELLQKAVKAGYKEVSHMAKDADLDSLRERKDFKKLIAEIGKESEAKKETVVPPKAKE